MEECASILRQIFSAVTGDKKKEMLEMMIEKNEMGNDGTCEKIYMVYFFNQKQSMFR